MKQASSGALTDPPTPLLRPSHISCPARYAAGETLTGMSLLQSGSPTLPPLAHEGTAEWQAWVLARPQAIHPVQRA